MSSKSKFMLFAVGAAVGAIAGMLLSPDKGSEIRSKVSKRSRSIADSLMDFYSSVSDKYASSKNGNSEMEEEEESYNNTPNM